MIIQTQMFVHIVDTVHQLIAQFDKSWCKAWLECWSNMLGMFNIQARRFSLNVLVQI